MKIVIMGSGAIGSVYGGLLHKAGAEVIFVGRKPHVDQINKSGLKISGALGDFNIPIRALTSPESIDSADIVMITTKSYDTLQAAREIEHLAKGGAYVVVLQNGLGTEKQVEAELGTPRILRATTCIGALVRGPGVVEVTGDGLTEIGSHHEENEEITSKLTALLSKAGFNVRQCDNIEGVVWTKTIVNSGINPVGALTGLTNGEIYNNMTLRGLVIRLVEEAVEVVKALGIKLTTDDPVRYTLGTAKATGKNINSMLQDILAKKRTEIESITGTLIQIARQLGVETPVNEIVYALIVGLESKYLTAEAAGDDFRMRVDEFVEAVSNP